MTITHKIANTVLTPMVFLSVSVMNLVCSLLLYSLKHKSDVANHIFKCGYSGINLYLESCSKLKIRHFGDNVPSHESGRKCIFISNHPSMFDSVCLQTWLQKLGRMDTQTCVFVWRTFKYTPIGQLYNSGNIQFVGYGKDIDMATIKKSAQSIVNGDVKTIGIFPEGGIFPNMYKSSNEYAVRYNYKPLQFCCYPKIQGLIWLFEELSFDDASNIDFYDITIGYEGVDRRKLCDVRFSPDDNNVHIYCKKYNLGELFHFLKPQKRVDEEIFRIWLWDIFIQKNTRLYIFKKTNIIEKCASELILPDKSNENIRYLTAFLGILITILVSRK